MFGQIQYFQKGAVYRIRNRKTKKLIISGFEITTKAEENTAEQLWVVSEIKNDQYQIVSMRTGEALTSQQGKVEALKLQKAKLKQTQLWFIEKAEMLKDVIYFWIKPTIKQNSTLCASSLNQKCKLSIIDHTLKICLWQFELYPPTNLLLNSLSVIQSDFSKFVMEVPQHSHKEGLNIIQYSFNGKGNQRWIIELYEFLKDSNHKTKQFTIRNYCSDLHLTANFSKIGFKLIQTSFNCSPDQRWILLQIKDNIFHIQSVSNNSYFIGVSNEKGGSQISLLQDRQKCRWMIQGYYPSL